MQVEIGDFPLHPKVRIKRFEVLFGIPQDFRNGKNFHQSSECLYLDRFFFGHNRVYGDVVRLHG